ncbi:MAG: protein phosphatase 2C domain-containing protein [Gemmatimonadetes bacterium]|nr:protein phosphatase 2C domain-containing protein [Gemmatimonadota bacterium]
MVRVQQSPVAPPIRKPRDDEIDVWGLTHQGKVRSSNQDHFLICSLHKRTQVHHTSLSEFDSITEERVAFLGMVADGVGGRLAGEEASRLAVEIVAKYVTQSMNCYYTADATEEATFREALENAALACHEQIMKSAAEHPEREGMATTLTLFLGVWPRAYLLQVGDSRYYIYRAGQLTQVTRDQTFAQDLIDLGVITPSDPMRKRWANVLSSAIGGSETKPVVTGLRSDWDNVHLMCSDGLTKHVSDERIRQRLASMTSARQACETLLQDALDEGGTDNITIIVARTVRNDSP